MRNQDLFPIPQNWLDDGDELLVEGLHRWGEERLIQRRPTLGEDREELLLPALQELLQELDLRHLVWSEEEAKHGKEFRRGGTFALALEQVGRADVGLALGLANMFTLHIAAAGRDQLRGVLSGGDNGGSPMPAGALVLPSYGKASKLFHGLQAPARALVRGDALELTSDGALRPQCAGFDADYFGIVSELIEGNARVRAALILVPGDADGLHRGEVLERTGLAASRDAEIRLDGVRVPREFVLCSGDGALDSVLSWYRLGCAATFSGAMLAGHDILCDWGENRVIKGKGQIFRNNPLVAHQMGRIAGLIETSRLEVFGLAQLLSEGAARPSAAATSRAVSMQVGAAAMDSLDLAMEHMASAGYATEWQLERYWRDVKTLQTVIGPQPASLASLARHAFGSEEV